MAARRIQICSAHCCIRTIPEWRKRHWHRWTTLIRQSRLPKQSRRSPREACTRRHGKSSNITLRNQRPRNHRVPPALTESGPSTGIRPAPGRIAGRFWTWHRAEYISTSGKTCSRLSRRFDADLREIMRNQSILFVKARLLRRLLTGAAPAAEITVGEAVYHDTSAPLSHFDAHGALPAGQADRQVTPLRKSEYGRFPDLAEPDGGLEAPPHWGGPAVPCTPTPAHLTGVGSRQA